MTALGSNRAVDPQIGPRRNEPSGPGGRGRPGRTGFAIGLRSSLPGESICSALGTGSAEIALCGLLTGPNPADPESRPGGRSDPGEAGPIDPRRGSAPTGVPGGPTPDRFRRLRGDYLAIRIKRSRRARQGPADADRGLPSRVFGSLRRDDHSVGATLAKLLKVPISLVQAVAKGE